MKVYLWAHIEGVNLLNEDLSMWSKPYFVTHPQRTLLLKDRYVEGMNKTDLLCTVTDDELKQLVENAIIRWKPMLSYMINSKGELEGFAKKYIATAELN
ncbi:hypothetical protein [Lysinibacillus telephonicus]|uniref:hypothetical protein n=1 Tax=Lysinibacillus telephonicus TaxID=1714840 RepID=UPI003BA24DE9